MALLTGAARSSLGQQTQSQKPTLPAYSWGSSASREQDAQVFISSKHTAVSELCCGIMLHLLSSQCHSSPAQVEKLGRTSPGAVYTVPGALMATLEAGMVRMPLYMPCICNMSVCQICVYLCSPQVPWIISRKHSK